MKRIRRTSWLVAGCWIFGAIAVTGQTNETDAARAATQPPAKAVVRLGEILILSPRAERNLLEMPTAESVSLDIATSVVDEETIRLLGANTLIQAVNLAPGVFTETRGRKEKQFSSFRGQIYPYPDYALNGVWQRAFWEVPAFFPASAIGRIEVLRSGGALMVGPNSGLVGAINVVPRRFEERTTLFDAQAGSYDTYRSSLVHGDRFGDGDYTVGLSYYRTDGPDDENAAENFGTLFGTVGWDAAEGVHFELTAFGLTGDRELRRIQDPGSKRFQNRTEEFSPYSAGGAILRTLVRHGDESSTEFDLGYAAREADYRNARPGMPVVENDEDDREYNVGVLHARRLSDVNTLRLGLQYNRWVSPDGKRFFVGKRMDVDTISGVVMDEHHWERLALDGGVRLTRSYYRDFTDTTFNIVGDRLASRAIKDEWGDPAVTATLGAKYDLTRHAALYAHAAVGSVDAPPGAVSEGMDGVDREQRQIVDCGIEFGAPEKGTLSAGLFGTFRQDAVLLVDTEIAEDGNAFNTYDNRDIRQYGLELEYRSAPLFNAVTVFGNATVMESRQSVDGDWSTYREIPNVIAAAGFNAVAGRCDLNLFAKYVSEYENRRFADDGEYKELGDFVDVNMTGGVTVGPERATRLYVSLENVLDDEYSTVVGFPDYGFQAFAGVEHRF